MFLFRKKKTNRKLPFKYFRLGKTILFYSNEQELEFCGNKIQLSAKENQILQILAEGINTLVPCEVIERKVWAENGVGSVAARMSLFQAQKKKSNVTRELRLSTYMGRIPIASEIIMTMQKSVR